MKPTTTVTAPHRLRGIMLALLVAGCGEAFKSAPPTPLPASVQIQAAASAEPATEVTLSMSLPERLDTKWDFGDGSSPAEAHVGMGDSVARVRHSWTQPGDYTVLVTVSNSAGEKREARHTVSVGRWSLVASRACTGAGGRGWCWQYPRPSGNATADLYFIDSQLGWAVGEAGQILHTRDGGTSWASQASGVSKALAQVRFADALNGWAVGATTTLRTGDGGATWTLQAPPSGIGETGRLQVIDARKAVLLDGGILPVATADGGQTWVRGEPLVEAVSPAGVFWYRRFADIARSTDFGVTLTPSLPISRMLVDVGGIHFTTADHGWVHGWSWADETRSGTSQPTLWTTGNGGTSWTRIALSGQSVVLAMYADGSGWLADNGVLRRTRDGGASWSAVSLPRPPRLSLNSVGTQSSDGSTLWYDSAEGIELTRDGGSNWLRLRVPAEAMAGYLPKKLQVGPGQALWLHYAGQRVHRSSDSGTSWQQLLGPTLADGDDVLRSVVVIAAAKGYAMSQRGTLLATADGGLTWARRDPLAVTLSGRMHFADADNGWAIGGAGNSVYRSTDAGKVWLSTVMAPEPSTLVDLRFVGATRGWALQLDGAVYRSTDSGQNWQRVGQVPVQTRGLAFADANTGIAVCDNGLVARTTDGGASWTLRPTGNDLVLTRATFAGTQLAFAVGNSGTLLRSEDAGQSWSRVPLPTSYDLKDIAFADAQRGWIVGAQGTLLATTDGGKTWTLQASGTAKDLWAVHALDAGTAWIAGAESTLLVTATGGR